MRTSVPTRVAPLLVLALLLATPSPSQAQDTELLPLFLALRGNDGVIDVDGSSLQLHRIPLSFTLRSPDDHRWGFRLLLPLTFGTHEIEASTGIGDFADRIETVTVTPGVELLFRSGDAWLLKPFLELDLSRAGSGGGSSTLFSTGLRARGTYPSERRVVTVGAGGRFSSNRSNRTLIDDYTMLSAGADFQWRLDRRPSGREVRIGGYAIARLFPDLDLPEPFSPDLEEAYEVGFSLAADPPLSILKIQLPWIGVGYRFGDLFDGIRINFSFPF